MKGRIFLHTKGLREREAEKGRRKKERRKNFLGASLVVLALTEGLEALEVSLRNFVLIKVVSVDVMLRSCVYWMF